MDKEDLDREYSPSSCAPDFQDILARCRTISNEARAQLAGELDVSYGPEPVEKLDFFPAARPFAPIQVFVHGGHWQESSKEDSCFAAPALVRAGAAFVAIGYGLAPQRDLDAMVASVRRGLCWVREHAPELGSHPDRVYASGSSAGAHLVAMALACTPPGEPIELAGVCLLSGVYDLEPVRHSYVNDAVGMDKAAAGRNSPIRHLPLRTSRVIVARGAAETAEYARQHTGFTDALAAGGGPTLDLVDLVVTGRNHFDLPLDLGDPATLLGRAVLDQLEL